MNDNTKPLPVLPENRGTERTQFLCRKINAAAGNVPAPLFDVNIFSHSSTRRLASDINDLLAELEAMTPLHVDTILWEAKRGYKIYDNFLAVEWTFRVTFSGKPFKTVKVRQTTWKIARERVLKYAAAQDAIDIFLVP